MNIHDQVTIENEKDFDPIGLLCIGGCLELDCHRLMMELINCSFAEFLGEGYEAIRPLRDRAERLFCEFMEQHNLRSLGRSFSEDKINIDDLRRLFPPRMRNDLCEQVQAIIDSLRTCRDALTAAVGDHLLRTKPDDPLSSGHAPSTLLESVRQLESDYENLSRAVSHWARDFEDQSLHLAGLWSRAEGLYTALRYGVESPDDCIDESAGVSGEQALRGHVQSYDPEELAALIRKIIAHMNEVREYIKCASVEILAHSLRDYNPNWPDPDCEDVLCRRSPG